MATNTASKQVASSGSVAKSSSPPTKQRGDRSKRLLDLVMLLLRALTPVTFREIREQFTSYQTRNAEAGLRAFERDKADLLELGVPVRYVTPEEDEAVDEGGYVIDLKKFRLPEMELTTEEVSALVLAGSVARAVPGSNYARIVDLALKKLAFDMPDLPDTPMAFPPPESEVSQREPVLVHFSPSVGERALSDRFSSLEAATRNRKKVHLRYRSASNGYSQSRDVHPYGLVYRDGNWLLVGHCLLRKDVRSFRLDRIKELTVAPKPKSPDFERPESFDMRAYANRSPWTFQPEQAEPVELIVKPDSSHIAKEEFGAEATLTSQADKSTVVKFACGNRDYAVSRILAAKGGLEVKTGKKLKQALKTELSAIVEAYS